MRRATFVVMLVFPISLLTLAFSLQQISADDITLHSVDHNLLAYVTEAEVSFPFESIFEKDLADIADSVPEIEEIYIKDYLDIRPIGHLWAFIRINYTSGLSDYEKIDLQYHVEGKLEVKWYIDIVEPNYYWRIPEDPPPPWPGFAIGDLNVAFINELPDPIRVPDHFPTIQEAINAASDGNTIVVRNGTYYENVVVNKTVSLIGDDETVKPVIITQGANSTVYITANNVTIGCFNIQNHVDGSWGWGIILNHSSNSIVSGNIVRAPYAVRIDSGSGNNISNNEILRALPDCCVFTGLELVNSSDNIVTTNFLSYDCHSTLKLHNSSNNHITFNYLSGHFSPTRIYMDKSNNNSIAGNTIWKEWNYGRYMDFKRSSDNLIYHNNFLNTLSSDTAYIDAYSINNEWDNGCEGNYWSAYNGSDLNGDGVGDTPYVIDGNNTDNYPLINPYWNPADINHDLKVDIYDIVLACAAYSSTPSDPNWNPHCDIAEPYEIIDIYDIVMIAGSYGEGYNP